jgi:cell division GTPase FtsZ
MKLLVIGIGQCGGRIADRFARLNKRARSKRGIEIITGAFAINTDITDLSGLSTIKPDYKHRIAIGSQKTNGHGVGKISELAAEIARQDGDKVINAIRGTERFSETDAFLLIAGASGGTGSGSIAILTQYLKERYIGKPVYNAIVLPFQQEEETEARTIYNTATCLKSAYLVADAIFLIDNQRYINKNAAIFKNLKDVNARIVEPFYNLLCAGEERDPKYVASKVVDAGDITQTLVGWTVIGRGETQFKRRIACPFGKNHNFRAKMAETSKKAHTMDEAIGELSLTCNPKEASRALYLVSAPHNEMSMDVIKDIGDHLTAVAPNALIRSGDYPRHTGSIDVTLILSEISTVRKVTNYFTKAIELLSVVKARQQGMQYPERRLEGKFDDIPVLLS